MAGGGTRIVLTSYAGKIAPMKRRRVVLPTTRARNMERDAVNQISGSIGGTCVGKTIETEHKRLGDNSVRRAREIAKSCGERRRCKHTLKPGKGAGASAKTEYRETTGAKRGMILGTSLIVPAM